MTTPKPAGAACLKCPARDARLVMPQTASDPTRVRLAFVDDNPTRYDVEQGRLLAGKSGAMLERGLRTLGLTRADVHVTAAVLCECDKHDMAAAAKACRRRLQTELSAVAPNVVMPLGPYATQGVLSTPRKPRQQAYRGSVNVVRRRDGKLTDLTQYRETYPVDLRSHSYVMPVMHPFTIERDPQWGRFLEIDFDRVRRVLAHGWTPLEYRPETTLAVCETDLSPLDLLREREVCIDVETVGLDSFSTHMVCFVLADRHAAVIVPWSRTLDGRSAHWDDPQRVARDVSTWLSTRVAVTHNRVFDAVVLHAHGIHTTEWDDTLVATHSYASTMPKNLYHVASTWLDVGSWKNWESRSKEMAEMHLYCQRDGIYTIHAWHAVKEHIANVA